MRRRTAIALAAALAAVAAAVAAFGSGRSPDAHVARVRALAVPASGGGVLARAKLESPDGYRAARAAGARIAATPDRRSFYVQSPAQAPGGPTVVTFHGYLSTAFDAFVHWQREAARRGYGIIAIQWRLGRTKRDSYSPARMYAQSRALLRAAGVARNDALVHGYSSAGSRMYGVGALDRGRVFALDIADAGGARPGFPMYRAVFGGPRSAKPLRGTRWVMFCGGRDPDPQLTGCPIMRRTRAMVRARGGTIERFIVDPRSSHGGFYQNPANMRAALDVFDRVRAGG